MTKQEILDKLFSLHRMGIKPGLERTLALSVAAGSPHQRLRTIHVAGTNGKGAVCSLIASVLTEAGYKTGLYSSPHLVDFNERISINGHKISDDQLVAITEKLLPHSDSIGCTFFEVTTIIAFKYFEEQNVDFAIIETGLGGRYDSTNILDPELCVITSIDMDHSEFLGDTLEKIAYEKAGIIKHGTPVVSGVKQEGPALVIRKTAESKNAPLIMIDDLETVFDEQSGALLIIDPANNNSVTFFPTLHGKHQIDNYKLAFRALGTNFEKSLFSFRTRSANSNSLIYIFMSSGFENIAFHTTYKARLETIREDPLLILDVAHNPAAFKVLTDAIATKGEKFIFVIGLMADKAIDKILSIILPHCSELVLTKPEIGRAAPVELLYKKALKMGFSKVKMIGSVASATAYAVSSREPAVICGSFYVAGEAIPELNRRLNYILS